jgi:hypothetical protein
MSSYPNQVTAFQIALTQAGLPPEVAAAITPDKLINSFGGLSNHSTVMPSTYSTHHTPNHTLSPTLSFPHYSHISPSSSSSSSSLSQALFTSPSSSSPSSSPSPAPTSSAPFPRFNSFTRKTNKPVSNRHDDNFNCADDTEAKRKQTDEEDCTAKPGELSPPLYFPMEKQGKNSKSANTSERIAYLNRISEVALEHK